MIKFHPKKECDFCEHHHSHSIREEVICHIPYTGFSLAFAFAFLAILNFVSLVSFATMPEQIHQGYHTLFHAFHYLHIIVAVAGAMITFFRFSNNLLLGFLVAVLAPTFFCILSDILLPTVAGLILGVHMCMHVCFFDLWDTINMAAFMLIGVVCGAALLHHEESLKLFALRSHFMHIFVSCLASLFYIVAHGFDQWYNAMGILFVFLFIAVIIPCTLSDVVVPLYCARNGKKR